jgi:DNA-binding transcriptional MerR regulator
MSQHYSISELAREFDITTRTIRFYEAEGLLNPTREGQNRIYSDRDRVHLMLILRGKRLGFSLAESKELIAMYDPAGANRKQLNRYMEMIRERRLSLNQQIQDIQTMLTELIEAEHKCREALDAQADIIE